MSKIIDCITFFDNNFIFDLRYNIIKDYVDFFVVCESLFDHQNIKKKINFDPKKKYINDNKVIHIVLKQPFPNKTNAWQNQAIQREFILKNLDFAKDEDYIFFSDPDEIPNPKILERFNLKKKYGIFLQKFYNYKFNLFNTYESPWDGTRVCKKKNLKSIDYMRQKIKKKNAYYKFYRFDKEKSVELFKDGGWHFNNILSPEEISKKLKTFAHIEYKDEKYSNIEVIRQKINNRIDLFGKGEKYEQVNLDQTFPKYLIDNKQMYIKFII